MKQSLTYRSNVFNIKARPYQFCIVYTSNSSIRITEEKSREVIEIPKGSISFIERNLSLTVNVKKHDNGGAYIVHALNEESVRDLVNILRPNLSLRSAQGDERKLEDKIHIMSAEGINSVLFRSIKESNHSHSDLYKLACLITKSGRAERIYWSLCISASQYFADRVKSVIESDLSQKWRLSGISEKLNLSEVAVRKKLEAENTSFYQVLLDARMQKAAHLILDENHHISKVASDVGISSASYFIRTFSLYYGVTPKQFYLHYKSIRGT
ncbi:helix-turn-helix transcriptional regulator [Escherichia coli]|uniref:Virulence regulon transcriptional activator VirF n=1 Tax=Escherichia coli TA447 TaxID=656447 RepID=A0A1X3IT88_ECOLX|nr:helix-turn-helix transcriptional regulator [Escherichia coli]OSK88092.1 virulence regulon transcriptional activator VirF [Escherichia coli TA447]